MSNQLSKEEIIDEFRSIISHALLGCDIENVDRNTWELVFNECAKFTEQYANQKQSGMKWVKAEERLPNTTDDTHNKKGIVFRNIEKVRIYSLFPLMVKNIQAALGGDLTGWEWLDEQPPSDNDTVEMLLWMIEKNIYRIKDTDMFECEDERYCAASPGQLYELFKSK